MSGRNGVTSLVILASLALGVQSVGGHQDAGVSRSDTDFVAVGRGGTTLVTRDDAAHWSVAEITDRYVNGVVSDNRGRFFAVASDGLILLSTDGGGIWVPRDSGTQESLNGIAWDDAGTFVAVGANGILLVSTDDGETWTPAASGTDETLFFVATDRAGVWMVGGARGTIVRSTDGGANWSPVNSGSDGHIPGVASLGGGRWIGASLDRTLIISTDDGASWSEVEVGPGQPMSGVAADVQGAVVAVGWNGAVVRSEDGGETWAEVDSGTGQRLEAVTNSGRDHFMAVGFRGTVTRSTDGGRTWLATERIAREVLHGVASNRLPDLNVGEPRLDGECQVVVDVMNGGPATLPPEAWDDDLVSVVLHGGEEVWETMSLASLDPGRTLVAPGSVLSVSFGQRTVSDSIEVTVVVDPENGVAEAQERNNSSTAQAACSG